MKLAIAAILTLGILVAGCSSGLTDAQVSWCVHHDNRVRVSSAGSALGLKSQVEVWLESNPDGDRYGELLFAPYKLGGGDQEFLAAVYRAYLEHPDGNRACIAAFDSR